MPGFFGNQAERLQRKFKNVQQLADELYCMIGADLPMESDVPLILRRNSEDEPIIRIIDNTDGTTSPIQIVRTKGGDVDTPAVDTGGFDCCHQGDGGGASGNREGDEPPKPKETSGGGPVTLAPPPGGAPYRLFQGRIQASFTKDGNDPYGFNGTTAMFVGAECRPYNPPAIPAPTSALIIGDIARKLDNYAARWGLSYTIFEDLVSAPGRTCQPGESFNDSLAGLPQFNE